MTASQGPRISRVRLGKICGKLHTFAMHGKACRIQFFRQPHGALSDLTHFTFPKSSDNLARLGIVAITQAICNRLVRVAFVVLHHIGKCRTARNRIHSQLINLLHEFQCLFDVKNTDIGCQKIEWFIIQLGSKSTRLSFLITVVDVLMTTDAATKTRLVFDDIRPFFHMRTIKGHRSVAVRRHKVHLRHRV